MDKKLYNNDHREYKHNAPKLTRKLKMWYCKKPSVRPINESVSANRRNRSLFKISDRIGKMSPIPIYFTIKKIFFFKFEKKYKKKIF